jgi:hypothetical protein
MAKKKINVEILTSLRIFSIPEYENVIVIIRQKNGKALPVTGRGGP